MGLSWLIAGGRGCIWVNMIKRFLENCGNHIRTSDNLPVVTGELLCCYRGMWCSYAHTFTAYRMLLGCRVCVAPEKGCPGPQRGVTHG